jgi:hypothetical protein
LASRALSNRGRVRGEAISNERARRMTKWIDEQRRKPRLNGAQVVHRAWMGRDGQFTLTVVPHLNNSWRNEWLWTIRESKNAYFLVADGSESTFDDARKAVLVKARELVGQSPIAAPIMEED